MGYERRFHWSPVKEELASLSSQGFKMKRIEKRRGSSSASSPGILSLRFGHLRNSARRHFSVRRCSGTVSSFKMECSSSSPSLQCRLHALSFLFFSSSLTHSFSHYPRKYLTLLPHSIPFFHFSSFDPLSFPKISQLISFFFAPQFRFLFSLNSHFSSPCFSICHCLLYVPLSKTPLPLTPSIFVLLSPSIVPSPFCHIPIFSPSTSFVSKSHFWLSYTILFFSS